MSIATCLFNAISRFSLLCVAGGIAGCSGFAQRDFDDSQQPVSGPGNGIIVGSVTAPVAGNYHESVRFKYRGAGDNAGIEGVLTSAIRHKNFLMPIPSCGEGGLPAQCGRLFAISLPPGDYEIYAGDVIGRGDFQEFLPARFTVTAGTAIYLGNLNAMFCVGMVNRFRGNILGADVDIRDEYSRDIVLARQRFTALGSAQIDKRLLPDHAWSWRLSMQAAFRGAVEPHDWGECGQPGP